jgi:hypothetical protein
MHFSSARFLLITSIVLLVPNGFAADAASERLVPFVMLDVAAEKDAMAPLKNEYFNKHITVGMKTGDKWEYSLKLGTSDKDSQTYELMSNVIEGKIKKSFELKKGIYPYFSARRLSPTPLALPITVLMSDQNFHCQAHGDSILDFDGGTQTNISMRVSATMRCCCST